ncbi:Holliday junction resolvase RuvX, partial [Candidatus Uhrbacteria bacterium]|nr:Holliday junction resolvase RuvX [Candidatus Uhrbacteria bacterium]
GETERSVTAFIEALRRSTKLSIEIEDERLTTAAVERRRKDAGIKKGDFDRDAAAAAAILETFMARKKKEGGL